MNNKSRKHSLPFKKKVATPKTTDMVPQEEALNSHFYLLHKHKHTEFKGYTLWNDCCQLKAFIILVTCNFH